jgi:hypothetical protein
MPILNKRLKEDIGKKSILHAILFKKTLFNPKTAREWLKSHNYNYIHHRETKNIYRFRIKEQVKGMKFYTIKLNNGVELIYMY